ncbi:MAG TPA: alpha/beta hydrolase [Blastocatellia bacterium]|nr:alpha/beta hydrolase [Blastocatellia bacterium]
MHEFTFTTSDGAALAAYKWEPNSPPRAVVHIAHGLAEHAVRYARTAQSLNSYGYVVYAHDMRGHGQTVNAQDELGFLAEANGWQRVMLDLAEMLQAEAETHADLPMVLLGHSFGSYLTQQLICEYPHLLAAAILSAPNGKPSLLAQAGRAIARAERLRLGKRGRSQLINSMTFGKFNEAFAPVETPFDWLSRDAAEVRLYFNDARCGFISTTQLWVDFLDGIVALSQPSLKRQIPATFPLYIIAGGHDPVCENGKGAEVLVQEYKAAGLTDVTYKLYPEARHELLNEINRHEVVSDLVQWLTRVVA